MIAARGARSAPRTHQLPTTSYQLLLVFHVHVLGVDDTFVLLLLRLAAGSAVSTRSRIASRWCSLRLVHSLGQLVRSLGQVFACRVHELGVGAFQRLLGVGQRVLDIAAFLPGDLVAMLAQHFFDLVHHAVKLVARLDFRAPGLVLGRVSVGFLRHALHFLFAQAGRRRDRNLLVFARGHVLG